MRETIVIVIIGNEMIDGGVMIVGMTEEMIEETTEETIEEMTEEMTEGMTEETTEDVMIVVMTNIIVMKKDAK